MKLFSKVTTPSVNNNINKERGGKYDMDMVPLLFLLFDAAVFLVLIIANSVQD